MFSGHTHLTNVSLLCDVELCELTTAWPHPLPAESQLWPHPFTQLLTLLCVSGVNYNFRFVFYLN